MFYFNYFDAETVFLFLHTFIYH